MKVFLWTFVCILATSTSWGNNNPLIRVCRLEEGHFWVLQAGNNDIPLCFFGKAALGAEALLLFKTTEGSTEALKAYNDRNSSAPRGGVCGSFDADVVEGLDSDGQTFNVCRFSDSSYIEETTLWLGPGHSSNAALDKALSKTY